jgi:hypothetical protein
MHFNTKNYLKNTHNHTAKHALVGNKYMVCSIRKLKSHKIFQIFKYFTSFIDLLNFRHFNAFIFMIMKLDHLNIEEFKSHNPH